ncbi:hypothetical protein [Streptomyces sp. NPDC059814]|uniref:hypothetical protein n=1 Tax=unclassified Streptomyces TaxID=2593676 RepID=UPI003669DEB5
MPAVRSRPAPAVGNSRCEPTDLGGGQPFVDRRKTVLDDSDRLVPKARIMVMQQQAHGASLTGERTLVAHEADFNV